MKRTTDRKQHCENCGELNDILILTDGTKLCYPKCYRAALVYGRKHIPEAFEPEELERVRFQLVIPCYHENADGTDGPRTPENFHFNITEGPWKTVEEAIEFIENEVGFHVPCYIEQGDDSMYGEGYRSYLERLQEQIEKGEF